jgi:ABC-type branched-subunit amino acid transport system permease subunit
VGLTNGPLCVAGVPTMQSSFLSSIGMDSAAQQYEIFLVLAVVAGAFIWALVKSRIGRAFIAVREDEPMAMSVGINPKRYRMIAFVVGAAIAGLLGAFYAHYISVVCPTNLDISYTVSLLVIIFLGGVGGFWGIVLAAFVFTAIPEILQLDPSIRLIVYGAALLLGITFLPEGFEGLFSRLRRRQARRKVPDA